jgi:hypothetical protein
MNARFRAWALCAVVAASPAAVLFQSGCGTGESTVQPQATTCSVTGNVSRFGIGEDRMRVIFKRVGAVTGQFIGPVDEAGNYRLDLPAGEYLAATEVGYTEFWRGPDGVIASYFEDADTLRFSAETPAPRVDFRFGCLHLGGEVPAGMVAYRMNVKYLRKTAWSPSGYSVRSSRVDVSDGLVDFDSGPLPPGDYRIQLIWESPGGSYGEQYFLPGTAWRDSATWYRAGVDSLGEISMAFPGPEARLEGHITGAWQSIQSSGPRVTAYGLDGVAVAGPCRLESDGRFAFAFHRPVPVKLKVADSNINYWVGGPRQDEAAVFTPVPGETIGGADAVIPGAVIRVGADFPRSEYYGITLEFMDPVERSTVMWASGSLGDQLVLNCALPGQYLLRATCGSFGSNPARPQWFDRAATPEDATLVTIPGDGSVLHLDVTMERGGTISGMTAVATDSLGWGWIVVTRSADDMVIGSTWTSGSSGGEFQFEGLEDGSYKVGYQTYESLPSVPDSSAQVSIVWYPGTADWNAATPIVISNAGDVTGIVIDVP